jgi:hypothetical protein
MGYGEIRAPILPLKSQDYRKPHWQFLGAERGGRPSQLDDVEVVERKP